MVRSGEEIFSASVVGLDNCLDLELGLSMVRRCSLKRSFKRRLVSPMYCKLQRLHWIMQIRILVSQVRLDLIGRVSPVENLKEV